MRKFEAAFDNEITYTLSEAREIVVREIMEHDDLDIKIYGWNNKIAQTTEEVLEILEKKDERD
jgi:hypothetical protein